MQINGEHICVVLDRWAKTFRRGIVRLLLETASSYIRQLEHDLDVARSERGDVNRAAVEAWLRRCKVTLLPWQEGRIDEYEQGQ